MAYGAHLKFPLLSARLHCAPALRAFLCAGLYACLCACLCGCFLQYNVGVSSTSRSLSDHALINISWSCDPERAGAVLDRVLAEIDAAAPTDAEVAAVHSILAEKHTSDALSSNSFWVFWLLDAYKAWALEEGAKAGGLGPGRAATRPGRAAWVDGIAAANSIGLVPGLVALDAAALGRVVREAMPTSRCVALTLMPTPSQHQP